MIRKNFRSYYHIKNREYVYLHKIYDLALPMKTNLKMRVKMTLVAN